MIAFVFVMVILFIGGLGWIIVRSALAHRYWRRVIADGDTDALHAALLEAFETWRRTRPDRDIPPADWRALQSAELIAADSERCRVSILVEPDTRVQDGQRREIGPAMDVAERAAVGMVERVLYEIPLARLEAVQVDAYTEYRSADGRVETECLLTVQISRAVATTTPWDEASTREILAEWGARRLEPGGVLDPDEGALILADDAPVVAGPSAGMPDEVTS